VAVSTLDPEPETSPSTMREKIPRQRENWGIGSFRFHFNLENLRPGRGFALRRFSVAEAAVLLMMGILASRGLGVIRQVTFNAIFGTSVQASAYVAAFRLPDTLFNLVAGGTLIHAFVPIFVSYDKERSESEIWRLASLVFNIMFATLAALLLIAEFVAPVFVNRFLVPGFSPSEQALTTTLTRVMLFQPLILGLSTVMSGVLSSRRQFALPALAIAVYNIGLIGGLICTLIFPSTGIYGPTFGVLAAAACHFAVQVPGLVKQKVRYFFVWDLKDPGLHAVLRLLIPSLLAVGVASIGSVIDISFTSFFRDKGSIAAINNAELLFALPFALLAQVVARAALPRMSLLALKQHYVHLRKMVIKVVGAGVLLSIPAAIFLALFGKPVIHLLFQHGAFTRRSSSLVYYALVGYALILPARVADELLNRSFYALKDARTPLFMDIIALGARVGLIVMLVRVLHGKYLLMSIPLAVGGAAALEAVLLGFLLLGRLRTKISTDQSMRRLQRQREAAGSEEHHRLPTEPEQFSTNGRQAEPAIEPGAELLNGWKVESEAELAGEDGLAATVKLVEPDPVTQQPGDVVSEHQSPMAASMPVETEIQMEAELPTEKLAESHPQTAEEQQEAPVRLEPVLSPEKQEESEVELIPEQSGEPGLPEVALEQEITSAEQKATKPVSKPASSAKKRAGGKSGTGKGNRQRRSTRSKAAE
jgi:putative peptidoglycan lipid II flippase